MDVAGLSIRHSPETEEVRQILLHACQLCRRLDTQLITSSDSAAQFCSHLPLIHQIVGSFRNGIKLLRDFIPDVQQLPSVVSNSLVQSPPNMNCSVVSIVETVNCKSELLTLEASPLEEHVMPMILEPSVPMKVPVTTSKLRTPGEKRCMKNHADRAIYKKRNVNYKSKPRIHERQKIASCPDNSTNDIANNSLETEGIDSSRDDQPHPKLIRALKNIKKGTWLPRKTVRLQGNQMDQLNDPYTWRKYGQKSIHGTNNPRSYYRCSHRDDFDCPAKKRVQKCDDQACAFDVTYVGNHTCGLVQLENQLTGGSISLPDLFPKNHVLVSPTCFQSSASAIDTSNADLYHQFGLESPRMHSMSPGERTQDTKVSLAASSSLSAQPSVSDFSFSSSNHWSLHVNDTLTILLPKTREISSKQDATAWDYSKPPQRYQDLHASSSVESTERPFTGLGRPYTSSRDNSLVQQGSISPATPEISSHLTEIVNGSLREQFSQYAEPEATDFLPTSFNSEYEFLDDYILFDIED